MVKTEIREFEPQYQRDIIEMITGIQQKEYSLPITENDQPDLAGIEEFYIESGGNFWVALSAGEVAGTAAIKNIGGGSAVLRKMFVKKEYRGKNAGVSADLLSKSIGWANEKGFKTLYLGTTPRFLAAHRFYEKNGFEEICREELPAEFPVMAVDKKFYRFRL